MAGALRNRLEAAAHWHRKGCLTRYVTARLLAATGLCRWFVIPRGGYTLRFHPSALATTLWACPMDRDDDRDVFTRMVRPGDTVVDVGANIGDLTLHAAALAGANGRVVAIEPHPRTFAFLQENIALNGANRVRAIHTALGSSHGLATLSDRHSDDQNAITDTDVDGGVRVPVQRLDELDISGAIHLLKIDVEGYEKYVLDGATGLLDRVEAIYFEAWEPHFRRFGYSVAEIRDWLERRGFGIYVMRDGRLHPAPAVGSNPESVNLLALRPSALARLQP